MAGVKVLVSMDLPDAKQEQEPTVSIEDKVKHMIELVESGYRSNVEWRTLNKLYADLKDMKSTPRIQNLMQMIEPVLAHYGYHKVSTNAEQ